MIFCYDGEVVRISPKREYLVKTKTVSVRKGQPNIHIDEDRLMERKPKINIPEARYEEGILRYVPEMLCPNCGGKLLTQDGKTYFCLRCGWPKNMEKYHIAWYDRIWFWLNNKKTVIGFITATTGQFLVAGKAGAILRIVGAIFGSIGVVHKGQKVLNQKTSGEKINWEEVWKAIINFIKKLLTKGGEK